MFIFKYASTPCACLACAVQHVVVALEMERESEVIVNKLRLINHFLFGFTVKSLPSYPSKPYGSLLLPKSLESSLDTGKSLNTRLSVIKPDGCFSSVRKLF